MNRSVKKDRSSIIGKLEEKLLIKDSSFNEEEKVLDLPPIEEEIIEPITLPKKQRKVSKGRGRKSSVNAASEEETESTGATSEEDLESDAPAQSTNVSTSKSFNSLYNPVYLYLKRFGNKPLLTPEEEKELAKRSKEGDIEARNTLIVRNIRLAINAATKSRYRSDLPKIDLFHEANEGLFRAIIGFDLNKGCRLTTYAVWWLFQAMSRGHNGSPIRRPIHILEYYSKIQRFSFSYQLKNGKLPSEEEIMEKFKLTKKQLRYILRVCRSTVSLDTKIGENKGSTLTIYLSDEDNPNPAESARSQVMKDRVFNLLDNLPLRERSILKLKYGIEDKEIEGCNGEPKTLDYIGKRFRLTRERIRQIIMAVINKLTSRIQNEDSE